MDLSQLQDNESSFFWLRWTQPSNNWSHVMVEEGTCTMPRRDTVAGVTLAKQSVSKIMCMLLCNGIDSPLFKHN
jgi:hypothetical protein